MSDCGCEVTEAAEIERKTLWVLLAINGVMFTVEAAAGWLGASTGLLADSLDMFADASVYGISLYAVGRHRLIQAKAATTSGLLQIALGIGVLVEVALRIVYGSEPASLVMIVVGSIALVANVSCLLIIAKHREGGVHMRASWIFSLNDVIANLGVIVSGGLVFYFGTRLPDLVIGTLISIVVIRGGIQILREAKVARRG